MAQEQRNTQVPTQETVGEVKDRGMFGFMGKKEEEKQQERPQENISSELGQKAHVSEENKPGLMGKLHRSGSSSSSSSEEEVEEGGQKIRRKKDKKGLAEKVKSKITGQKDTAGNVTGQKEYPTAGNVTGQKEYHNSPACATAEGYEGEDKENKGMLEKIKKKIPGMHSKTEDGNKDCGNETAFN